ncbi:hypothetical protein Y032_0133g1781 [Ancylostoma ceylanicum]|uniref:Uncharacterized protein n=1 Tax=Ancylostoma ceylanicum TaxID=53326 RepID=A0A016T6D0_9BILA|nr:hypothetical protein Y032_0133g1781 [Ancylostoma ceylanicum]
MTRSSTMAANDIDSGTRGAVAWRACQGVNGHRHRRTLCLQAASSCCHTPKKSIMDQRFPLSFILTLAPPIVFDADGQERSHTSSDVLSPTWLQCLRGHHRHCRQIISVDRIKIE